MREDTPLDEESLQTLVKYFELLIEIEAKIGTSE